MEYLADTNYSLPIVKSQKVLPSVTMTQGWLLRKKLTGQRLDGVQSRELQPWTAVSTWLGLVREQTPCGTIVYQMHLVMNPDETQIQMFTGQFNAQCNNA